MADEIYRDETNQANKKGSTKAALFSSTNLEGMPYAVAQDIYWKLKEKEHHIRGKAAHFQRLTSQETVAEWSSIWEAIAREYEATADELSALAEPYSLVKK